MFSQFIDLERPNHLFVFLLIKVFAFLFDITVVTNAQSQATLYLDFAECLLSCLVCYKIGRVLTASH